MKTSSKPLEDSQVLLEVEIAPDEFEKALEKAARDLASQVRIPGFRKGKVPRQVLEARFGSDAISEEAVRQALPGYLAEAIEEEGLDVVGRPSVDKIDAESDSGLTFEATCDVRPEIDVPDWEGLEVEVPALNVTDEDVDEQAIAYLRQSAPVEAVSRPSTEGDFVLIDLSGRIHDEEVPGTSLSDFLYEVGSKNVLDALDDEVTGKRAGDILKFNATLPESFDDYAGQEAAFTVMVKEVRERRLPELDNDWVDENTEFETVDEFKTEIRDRLGTHRKGSVATAAREGALKALASRVEASIPEVLIDEEIGRGLEMLNARLRLQGLDLGAYLRASGASLEEMVEHQREPASDNVKSDLALRAIAREEGLDVTDEDRSKHVEAIALSSERSPEEVRESLDKARGWGPIEADIIRHKSLDLAITKAVLKDDSGNIVDWSDVIGDESE